MAEQEELARLRRNNALLGRQVRLLVHTEQRLNRTRDALEQQLRRIELLNGLALPNPGLLLLWAVLGVIGLLVNIYFFALLAMIILSWVAPGSNHPAIHLLYQITEPVMAPFRKALPPMGGMDFSPILVFILINVIQIALRHMAAGVGLHPALVIGL